MKKLLLSLFILICGVSFEAGATDCEFQHRPNDFFFRKLPKEIVGWIKCMPKSQADQEMNVVFVARTQSLSRESVLQLFSKYESVVVVDRTATKLIHSKTNGWMELESQRASGTTSHVLFGATALDGSFLTFLYTDTPQRAKQARSRLGGLKDYFTVKGQAQQLIDAIEKLPNTVHAAN